MTVRQGNRLRFCHTITESAPSGRATPGRAGSSIRAVPDVAASRPPTICTSVLLPQPLGPSRQEKRREPNRCEKRSSATTSARLPPPQTCVTLSTTTSMRDPYHRLSSNSRAAAPVLSSHAPCGGETVVEASRGDHTPADLLGLGDRTRDVVEMGEL